MSAEETKKELELQSKITDQILLQTKSIRERTVSVRQATTEYEANLAILKKQNDEAKSYDSSIKVANKSSTAMYNSNVQGANDSSSAMGVLVTATKALNQEMFNAARRLDTMSLERRALTSELAKELGGSSRLFNELATGARTASDMFDSTSKNVVGKMKDYYKTFGEVAGAATAGLQESQLEFIAQVNSTDRAFLSAQTAMDQFYRSASGFKEENGKLVSDSFFTVQGVPLMDVMGGTKEAFQPFLDLLTDETLQQPFAQKMLAPDKIDESLKELKRIDVAMLGLGLRSDQVTSLVRTNYLRSGEASTEYFDEVVKAAEMGQNAFGYNAQTIVGDIYKMTQNIEVFGFRSGDEFAKIAARTKDLHMTIEDLQGAMGKFDTFESAAQTVGQLNAALGTNFDAMELMTLKYEDPGMMLEKLREGLLSTGKTFDEIPITYKRMITQQLGITMEGVRGLMDGNVRSLDQLTAQQEGARAKLETGLDSKQQQAALDARLESRVKEASLFSKTAQDMNDLAERAAKIFSQGGVSASNMAEKTADSLKMLSKEYTSTVAPAIKAVNEAVMQADQVFTKIATEQTSVAIKAVEPLLREVSQKLVREFIDQMKKGLESVLNNPQQLKDAQGKLDQIVPKTTPTPAPTAQAPVVPSPPGRDVVMKGELDEGDRVILSNYGSILRSTLIDKNDTLFASPTVSKTDINQQQASIQAASQSPQQPAASAAAQPAAAPTAAPPASAAPALPAVSDAIRASLQGAGSSLRIELDVSQLTDLILRDIMMNKPNVFGGLA